MEETTAQEPDTPLNLQRRIKRHVWAPVWDWFAVCSPGLEDLCAAELTALGLEAGPPRPGGAPFRGKLEACYRANLGLAAAARVLMRLADFRVRNWSDLTRRAQAVPWEALLKPGAPVRVRVALRESNLKHSGSVGRAVLQAAEERMSRLGLEPPSEADPEAADSQLILVRGAGRRAVISLDSSGEHLHRRGYRRSPGQAPLREDLAAALLRHCGYTGEETLLDPMCGAGTLAVEAALLARRLPPGGRRAFAFERWACHRAAAWNYLRRQALDQALPQAPAPILARDLRGQAVKLTRANARRAGAAGDLETAAADFFSTPPPRVGRGLLVFNPPWGKRLGSVSQAREFMARAGRKLRADYPGWRVGAVLYRPEWAELLGLAQTRELAAPHGGVKVTLIHGLAPQA